MRSTERACTVSVSALYAEKNPIITHRHPKVTEVELCGLVGVQNDDGDREDHNSDADGATWSPILLRDVPAAISKGTRMVIGRKEVLELYQKCGVEDA
ncbi:hypothetical protein NDU88_004804 [Pleurodeles waltl]|uniref:Uncharacterized protein n=1 Tax=Pleurodeles waltl TaxID=8319 RepID=A0AAV7TT12_PLEWA|nr:hypothetical protein NDU88_004804 [Pleurodeles waltl]